MRTKPLIPEMCFTTITEEDSECEEQPVTPHLEEDGTSLLISCSQCSVRVHTSQYTQCFPPSVSCVSLAASVWDQNHCDLHWIDCACRWQHMLTDGVCSFCRLLRCGSCHCEQGVEVCTLQGQRHDRGQSARWLCFTSVERFWLVVVGLENCFVTCCSCRIAVYVH